MMNLLDLFNTSDARSILIDDNYDVDAEELIEASEAIVQEWEKLRDSNAYQNHIRDKEFYMYKQLEKKALAIIIISIEYGFLVYSDELINLFKFKIGNNIKEAERKLKMLNNWFRLHGEKNKDEDNEHVIWEELKVYTEHALGYQIDFNCTATQYLAYEKIVKKIEAAKIKQLHGKEN